MHPTSKTLAGAVWILAALSGCVNPIDEIDEEFDCANLCERYRDCFDAQYEVQTCRQRCQGVVDGVAPGRADRCDSCLDPRSCIGAAFGCGEDCQGLLP